MAVASISDRFFVSGGTVPLEAPSYVERAADRQILEALRDGKFCYVLNSRQMGKSSLCVRTKARLELEGIRTAFVDLTKIGGRNVTPEQWYAGLMVEIGRSLELRAELMDYWKEQAHLSPMQRLFGALREVVLERIASPVVIFIDEIDSTRSLPFDTDEFFAGIRECYNRRAQDPTYRRLTFCLLGVAVPSDLIHDARTTPFNIGERVYLRDFTLEEAMALARGLVGRERLVNRVHYWTGGHPFLTQSLCTAVVRDPSIRTDADVDTLVQRELFEPKARETNINLADVGNRVLNGYADGDDVARFRADILSAYDRALRGKETLYDDESNRITAVLKLSGLMRTEGKALRVRNPIYVRVFGREWVKENMPGQELRRQRRAFWVGVARTAALAGCVLAVIGWLAWNNARLKAVAEAERDRANYEVYVSDMGLMPVLWERGDLERMRQLLKDTERNPARGWEWELWNRFTHQARWEMQQEGGFGYSLSRDGKRLLVSFPDRFRLVDTESFKTLKEIPRSAAGRSQPVWLPDGKRFIEFGDVAGTVVRDVESGKVLGTIPEAWGSFTTRSVSPDGKWKIGSDNNGRPVLLNLATFTKRRLPSTGGSRSEQFSSRGRLAAWREEYQDDPRRDTASAVLDTATWKTLWRFRTEGAPGALAFSPDERRLVTGSQKGWLQCWDLASGREVWRHKAQEQAIMRVDFSDSGRRLITSGRERFANVFEITPTGAKRLRTFPDASNALISPDGKRAYVGYWSVRAYDVDAKEAIPSLQLPLGEAPGAHIYSDGVALVGGPASGYLVDLLEDLRFRAVPRSRDIGTVAVYHRWAYRARDPDGYLIENLDTGRRVAEMSIQRERWFPVCEFPRTLKTVLAGPNQFAVWDLQRNALERTEKLDVGVSDARISPDERYLVLGKFNGGVEIIDLANWSRTKLKPHISPIWEIDFSPTSKQFLTVSDDDTACVMDLATGREAMRLRGHAQTVRTGAFSPDGSRYATGSDDRTIRIWDAKTGRELTVLSGHGDSVRRLRFLAGGKVLASVDRSGLIKLWPTGELPRRGQG